MKKTAAIIQARMGSSRLPGKVLKKIKTKPLLWHVIKRVYHAETLDEVIVATTKKPEDDPIRILCKQMNTKVYSGSNEDVLDRYYQTAKKYHITNIVRITADCPVIDPHIIDQIVDFYLNQNYDYVSNTIHPTFPDGIDTEVFRYKALQEAWKNATLPSEREHVTPYIWKHPDFFTIKNIENKVDLSHLRWTVDEPEDLLFIREIYNYLYSNDSLFYMQDILHLLKKYPKLKDINKESQRNEGYQKSLRKDKLIKK